MFLTDLPIRRSCTLEASLATSKTKATTRFVPAISYGETSDAYLLQLEIPGVEPESVELTLENGRLTVRGEKVVAPADEDTKWHVDERRSGAFTRVFRFPSGVEADQVTAETKNGVLTVRVPKVKEAIARRIDIAVK